MRGRRFRAILAILALFASSGFDAEKVAGEMRDGAVHHESAGEAAAHAERTVGEHGHEDSGSQHADHGPGHSHGTTSDHCTHQHGTPAPGSFSFTLGFRVTIISFTTDIILTPTDIDTFLRPPSLG